MKKRTSLASFVDWFYVWCRTTKFCVVFSKENHQRLKIIGGGYKGSKAEYESVKQYWKKYGLTPKKYWYQIYGDKTGSFDPRYIPDTVWYSKILPYFNNLLYRRAYADKAVLDKVLPQVKQPETVIKNIAGSFYTGKNEPITEEQAVKLCVAEDSLIFKPTVDSGSGRLIQFFDKEKMDEGTVRKYFKEYFANFTAQKILAQHPDLAVIHSKSLNTIRVISFRFKGKVYILSAQLRMGSGDSRIDNYSAGGIACAIKEDGWLENEAITRQYTWTDSHPSGRKFNTIQVPSYHKILEKVYELHPQLPYFGIVGWDFAVSTEGEPVLIEFNLTPGQNQVGSRKPTFGELSEEVFQDVFIDKSLKGKLV